MSKVTLQWTASTDAVAGYNVYRGAVAGAENTKLNTALITGTQFVDNTPAVGKDYYVVKSVVLAPDGSQVESLASNEVTVNIPVPLPAVPTNLVAVVS